MPRHPRPSAPTLETEQRLTSREPGTPPTGRPRLALRGLLLFAGLLAAFFLCFKTRNAAAQINDVHVSQLGHRAWRLREGALPGTPNVIAQTKDGFFWIGTETGLYRFDGEQF